MKSDDHLDMGATLNAIRARRPTWLDASALGREQIEWAVGELEAAGVHPSLAHVARVIGRGTQKAILAYVNEVFRDRARRPTPPASTKAEIAIRELHDVIVKHLRSDLADEFTVEREEIRAERLAVDVAAEEARRTLVQIEEQQAHTATITDQLRTHLMEAFQQRDNLQVRIDGLRAELVKAIVVSDAAEAKVKELSAERDHHLSKADDLVRERSVLQAACAIAESDLARMRETAAGMKDELASERGNALSVNRLLEQTLREAAALGDRLADAQARAAESEHHLARARSSLTRERALRKELESRVQGLISELGATRRSGLVLRRELATSHEAKRRAFAELQQLRREMGRLKGA